MPPCNWITSLCLLVGLVLLVTLDTTAARRGGRKKNKGSPPKWKSSSMPHNKIWSKVATEYTDIRLDCKVSGHPKPQVKWSKDGQPISSQSHIQVKKNVFLTISNISRSDSGSYTCQVKNKHGTLEWDFTVEVQKVEVSSLEVKGPIPKNATKTVGSTVEFKCEVTNDDKATIKWIGPEGREYIDTGTDEPGVLRLENLQKSDEGVYACEVSNKKLISLSKEEAYLTVIEPVDNDREDMTDDQNNGASDILDERDPLVDKTADVGIYDNADFGPEPVTTRRPRNRNRKKNRDKKKKKKNKKDKKKKSRNKNGFRGSYDISRDFYNSFTTVPYYNFRTTTTPPKPAVARTTTRAAAATAPTQPSFDFDNIWDMRNDEKQGYDSSDGASDTRYNPGWQPLPDSETERESEVDREEDGDSGGKTAGGEGAAGSAKAGGGKKQGADKEGSVSAWTIYTAVGAVCGVILLIGLVAVTLTLCCNREEEGVYKSATPV